jgi:hypothetical protein
MLTQREFSKKVREILDDYTTPIGATEGDMIRFKTHRIMELAKIPIDLREE